MPEQLRQTDSADCGARDVHHVDMPLAAAKLHVLDLAPIKEKLGDRWPRLEGLVQKLFESTIKKKQGPRDHFVRDGDLSYVATFHGFSPEETSLACLAIAQQVCQLLFGESVSEGAVRTLVGNVSPSLSYLDARTARHIATELERSGVENLVSSEPGHAFWPVGSSIIQAQHHAGCMGYKFALVPMWDLRRMRSQTLSIKLVSADNLRAERGRCETAAIAAPSVELEVLGLRLAAAYSLRLKEASQICAIVAGVSYETLSGFKSRISYIQALNSIPNTPTTPILIKVGDVPNGAPLGRLAEIISMLKTSKARVLIQFSEGLLPDVRLRLGAAGIGLTLSSALGFERVCGEIKKLAATASNRRLLSFVEGLDSRQLVEAAHQAGVNLGAGSGISTPAYDPASDTPSIPLLLRPDSADSSVMV